MNSKDASQSSHLSLWAVYELSIVRMVKKIEYIMREQYGTIESRA